MNPYLKITKDHVSTEDLLKVVSEREGIELEDLKRLIAKSKKKPAPKKMTPQQELEYRFDKYLEQHL